MADNSSTSDDKGGASPEASPFTPPQITLPKGGGAIRGIGEKFATNPVTGTGSFTVPIAVSPGRSGFGPQLSVAYDSGTGNGPFGMGFSLSLPSITRKTDKGLPQYRDDHYRRHGESDVFILSGSEDLVPVLLRDRGHWIFDEHERDGYHVKRYRPRIEGLFARIERWTRLDDGDIHWRSISRDNILTVYGFDAQSRIADPENPRHIYSWLICRSFDDKGNAIIYEYAAENDAGVRFDRPAERHRSRAANRYLKRIKYGNRRPLLLDPDRPSFRQPHIAPLDLDGAGWMFEVVFDYGGQHYREEVPDEDGRVFAHAGLQDRDGYSWPARRDPFSTYRSRFEIRTYRLCHRVLMFHHFPDELGCEDYLVRSTAFEYHQKPIGSFITRVIQCGHKREHDGRYLTRSLPPLDLTYTASPLEDHDYKGYRLKEIDPANLPEGIDNSAYRFVDLDGEGISGVLAEQGGAWFYKPNLGGGRFGATEAVPLSPSARALSGGQQQLLDLAGDGNLDLVELAPPTPGFFERTLDAGWKDFRAFRHLPVRDWNDPNLRFVDVTGDGIADVLITEGEVYTWHPSLLKEGFGAAVRVHVPSEEEETGPRAIFADGTQSIYLADMSGDGLSDLVRIRNGEVCYWPNRGRGCFGAKLTMDCSPWFDDPDQFDQQRIRLADTDGNGLTDILYLGRDAVRVYLNESGNGWSEPRVLRQFPVADNLTAVATADFLGRGTACLLWSSPLSADAGRPLRYVDLMDGKKPHLLERVRNNLGAETVIEYASSTEFYLADKAAGTPWVTRLAFPVYVVKRVETYDFVSRSRLVTRYTYHHGYYDGVEREFRGFGRVDQLDTEAFADLEESKHFPVGDNMDGAFHVPPVLTKTWFHTGVYLAGGLIARHMAHEYFRESPRPSRKNDRPSGKNADDHNDAATPLDDTVLPEHIGPEEAREACRALKGSMLRQELYALDGRAQSCHPYNVTERNYTIRPLQPHRNNRHAVFFTCPREAITLNYERNPSDPRTGHSLTLATDDYGNVLKSVEIGYPRRKPAFEEQEHTLATLTERQYTNAILKEDAYRVPRPAQTKTYELTAPVLASAKPLGFAKVASTATTASEIAYEEHPTPGLTQKRLIDRLRTLYRKNNLTALLPTGSAESLALLGENYKLALTGGLLDIFRGRASAAELASILPGHAAEYRDLDGDGTFWIPSGQVFYSPDTCDPPPRELAFAQASFFLPHRFQDPFGNVTFVSYDGTNNLLQVSTRDAVGNETSAEANYRVLQPKLVTDPNGNRAEARFDALGMLVGTALRGKATGTVEGDSFEAFTTDLAPMQLRGFFDAIDPRTSALDHLGTATTRILYDLGRVPICAASIARETHVSALMPGQQSKVQLDYVYSDGFGREAQSKALAEPGPLNESEATTQDPRWVGTGTKVYNNKGKPVRQFEPFFSAAPQFAIEKWGVSNTLFYDPLQRVIATLHPNNTFDKVVFDPWERATFDVNDTVRFDPATDRDVGELFKRLPACDYLPTWYQQRIDGRKGLEEKIAAEKTAKHADTPTIAHFDALGRVFLTVADNGQDVNGNPQKYKTHNVLDIEGHQRAIIDALGRVVMRYDYDMAGSMIRQQSMEGGERWMLNDVSGKRIRTWNSRQYAFRTEYDALRRRIKSFVQGGDPREPNAQIFSQEVLFEKIIYGDSADTEFSEGQQKRANVRGKVFRCFDGAGITDTDLYDFKGNSLRTVRRFTREYNKIPDWSRPPALCAESFSSATAYDALNRAVAVTTPDRSVYRPTYNEANLLVRVDVNLRGSQQGGQPVWTTFVTYINYDAKGQRTILKYANGAETTYSYDAKTFRLVHLKTIRPPGSNGFATHIFNDPSALQDLRYTYDPIGNITRIEDAALRTVFNDNQQIVSACNYTYDPLYRLIQATGREHIGQSAFELAPAHGNCRDYPFVGAAQLHDVKSLQNYTERYDYDPVGNFRKTFHQAANGNWTRTYAYDEHSLIDPDMNNNRLSYTALHTNCDLDIERYCYDAHGNVTQMPHLPLMQWSFNDKLSATSPQAVNDGPPETTCYVYDADGQRARKVTERRNGTPSSERLYIGDFEIYRKIDPHGVITIEHETLHVMDGKRRIALVRTQTVADGASASPPPVPAQRYQLANHLGSASLELDETGAVITYEEYSPFGNTTYQAGRSAAEVSLKRYRYTGKERDTENGFSYHAARYYAPWLGRWVACDPAGLAGGINLYGYAAGNPVRFNDQSGKNPNDAAAIKLGADVAQYQGQVSQVSETLKQVPGELARKEAELAAERQNNFRLFKASPNGSPELSESTAKIDTLESDVITLRRQVGRAQAQLPELEARGAELQRRLAALDAEAGGVRGVNRVSVSKPHLIETVTNAQSEVALLQNAKPPGGGGGTSGGGGAGTGGAGGGAAAGGGAGGTSTSGGGSATTSGGNTEPTGEAKPNSGGGEGEGGGGQPRPSYRNPSAGLTALDALGALGMANAIVTVITGKDPLGNFRDFVMGGLHLDPEARVRQGEVLHVTAEDRRAAEAQSIKRQLDQDVKNYAKIHGISEDEARRQIWQAAHQGPAEREFRPAP